MLPKTALKPFKYREDGLYVLPVSAMNINLSLFLFFSDLAWEEVLGCLQGQ